MDALTQLLRQQDQVIARPQLIDLGLEPHDIRRMARRRELHRVHTGVYVTHTAPLTHPQREWAAVLALWPAALSHQSALAPGQPASRIHVAVDRQRRLQPPPGVIVHRTTDWEQRVQANLSPPRIRFEEAVLDVAAAHGPDLDVVATLAEAVGSRRTTAARLSTALQHRERIKHRSLIDSLLRDIAAGTCSVLEHAFLTRVERPHCLPRGARQVHATGARGRIYRDVVFDSCRTIVELDGRLHDRLATRFADLERDLIAASEGLVTIRIGWAQVFDHACDTARALARALRLRGWQGTFRACPHC